MVDAVTCLNCFMGGAIMMLMALCIQPEVVQYIRKVYDYDFKEHRKKHEREEGLLLLQKRLNVLYDLTRDQCDDQPDEEVSNAWTNVDESIAMIIGEKEPDNVPFGFNVPPLDFAHHLYDYDRAKPHED